MKSSIYAIALVGCLSAGTVFAQGRGGGRGPIEIREPRINSSSPSDSQRGNSATTHATTREAQGPKDVSQQINDNPGLSKTLKDFFPMDTDLGLMAAGFKNLGQFVAAVHVSHNLDIPFETLKTKMVDEKMPLGEAIKSWKTEMSTTEVNAEVKKAEDQAKEDLKTTS